ncbi:MAG: ABC transporter ATP-binding protein [Proteobacteria bacterium]|nr:ABC transporter ATP-binding protein [Pseudomonadota bacterium]
MTAPVAHNAEAASADPLIRIRGLSTVLNGKTIFDKVDLDIPRGGVTAVMGPSGTGKTTLMRHITGQLAPDAGEVWVDGRNVVTLDRAALFALREKIGYLFQNSALLTDYSVFENVAFPLRQHLRLPEVVLRNLVLTKLQAVGLRGAVDLMPHELSGGMMRRVALARAIVRDPMLIIYDEPFVGLDPIALNQIVKLIRTLSETLGITSILVAHELSAVRRVADHIYLLAGGKIAAYGTPEELERGDTPWTEQFFTGAADGPVPFQYPAPDYAVELGLAEARR